MTNRHQVVVIQKDGQQFLARIPDAIFQNFVPPHPGFHLKFDQQAARDVDQTNDQLEVAVGLCEVRPNTGSHELDSVGGITPPAYGVDGSAVETLVLLHNRSLPRRRAQNHHRATPTNCSTSEVITLPRHTDTVAAVFTCTHCNAVPEQVVDGKAAIAIVRHKLGCPTLMAQTARAGPPRCAERRGGRPTTVPIAPRPGRTRPGIRA
jgi:hypothetical protein